MSNIKELNQVPEISFIDGISLSNIQEQWMSDVCAKYKELTGEQLDVPAADPIRLVGYATALLGYQALKYIDRAGKVDLLKYSYGDYLDNIAALKGIYRKEATGAQTTLRFTVSAVRTSATGIPGGVRVSDDMGTKFMTTEYCEIPAGSTYVDVKATALVPGLSANGLSINTINKFVDPVPYISSVTNTVASSGGDDVEGDDDLTYRVLMAPAGYSVAGPKEAYEYWARQFRTDISDVMVYTPSASHVTVLFMLDNGVAPDGTIIAALSEFLTSAAIRPLTDEVTVAAPTDTNYSIEFTYYINRSDAAQASTIQFNVNKAVNDYKKWQRQIGRDVNPSELIKRVVAAGAKRVSLTLPSYTSISQTNIANNAGETVTYGGLEDD